MKRTIVSLTLVFISSICFGQKKDSTVTHKAPIKTDTLVVVTFKLSEFNSFTNWMKGLDLKPSELQPAVKFIYDRAKLNVK